MGLIVDKDSRNQAACIGHYYKEDDYPRSMAGKKRVKLRGIKHTPKRLESDILERSKNLWEDPGVLRPKCAGKCFICPFNKTFSSISKLGKVKEDPDALIKLASRGSDDIFKAYCGTISLYAAGSIPYLATAKLAGEEVSFAQRGAVGNDKMIGIQYYTDPKIRLLLYNSLAKRKNLHIYSFEEEIVCSKKPNMPVDYIYDTFWDSPYEFPDDGLDCGHDSNGTLIIKIVSANESIRICKECAKDVSTLQFLISRLVAVNPLDDIEVFVEHKFHNEGGDNTVKIDDETVKKYAAGAMTDVNVLNSVLKDKIGDLKNSEVSTYIIGNKNYGSDLESFLSNLKGNDVELLALRKYLSGHNRSLIINTDKASEALAAVWDDYAQVLESFTNKEIADSFGNVSKMNPAQTVKEAHQKYISFDVVSKLPEFKRMGTATKYADTYAKAVKVGGESMLKEEMSKLVPKDGKTRSMAKAFEIIARGESSIKCSKEENDFAEYLKPFVEQLIKAEGDDYRDKMNTLLTALGCGETV